MTSEPWIWISALLAGVPASVFARNLRLYQPLPASRVRPAVSVLIPARNEEGSIDGAIRSVLENDGAEIELIVLDDHSDDRTAAIVQAAAARDSRVRLVSAPPLPVGWCGKQHACSVLSQHATNDLLCFLDADVRLASDALARMAGYLEESGADLISGFPRQLTGTFSEKLLIPLIHFVLLGFLPLRQMRGSTNPAFAAGCGQLMFARKNGYLAAGGHGAIRATLHDGLKLPKAFRVAGRKTDLFDATDIATCRMYHNAREVWLGLAKNATEGLAAPGRIVPVTLLLIGGQVLPFLLLPWSVWAWVPILAAWYPRFASIRRFRQPVSSALLHPLGVTVLLLLQWYALLRSMLGKPAGWKGRTYIQNA